jgi:hypothetical protein
MIVQSIPYPAASAAGAFGTHRYWRINVTQNSGQASITAIGEIEFYSTVGGADITGSGTALSGGSGTDSTAPSNAFDNSPTSQWSRSSATNTWVGYDFGSAVGISGFSLSVATGGDPLRAPQAFTLDWSDDGSAWTTATGGSFTCYGWLIAQTRTFPEATLAAGYHRFWRLFCSTNNGGSSFTGIGDVEFRATAGGADQTVNLSSNGPTSTGKIIGSNITTVGDEGWRAFDDSTASFWLGSGTTNVWVAFCGVSPFTVQEAMLQATSGSSLTRMVKDGKIEWSDDGDKIGGGTWTTAGTFTQIGWVANQSITVTVTP